MKQMPDVLEHGWTRRSGPQITVANLTAAQAKEQVEYDGCSRRSQGNGILISSFPGKLYLNLSNRALPRS